MEGVKVLLCYISVAMDSKVSIGQASPPSVPKRWIDLGGTGRTDEIAVLLRPSAA
jgi:hypothetical protein